MAFNDSKFWQVDLTTRAGAQSGAHQASIVCFVMAALSVLGLAFIAFSGLIPTATPLVLGFQALQSVVFLVAGLQLRKGKGFYLGVVALAFLLFNVIGNVMGMAIGGAILDIVLALVLGNGLRGAKALHDNRAFEDDHIDVFD